MNRWRTYIHRPYRKATGMGASDYVYKNGKYVLREDIKRDKEYTGPRKGSNEECNL